MPRPKELKIRLTEPEFNYFTTACEQEGIAPAVKARELILAYCMKDQSNGGFLSLRTAGCRSSFPDAAFAWPKCSPGRAALARP